MFRGSDSNEYREQSDKTWEEVTLDLNIIVISGLYKIYEDIILHVLSVCKLFIVNKCI